MRKPLRLSDLVGKQVRDEHDRFFGYVHEVRVKESSVTVLICGKSGFLQRLASFRSGRRIAWDRVRKMERDVLTLGTLPVHPRRRSG